MSIGLARSLAVLWLLIFLCAIPLGLSQVVMLEWRSHVATGEPTPQNSLAFVTHGRTYFAPPAVVVWHDRLATVNGVLILTLLPLTLIVWAAAHYTGGIGLRWHSGQRGRGKRREAAGFLPSAAGSSGHFTSRGRVVR